jgi:hypothetical protein
MPNVQLVHCVDAHGNYSGSVLREENDFGKEVGYSDESLYWIHTEKFVSSDEAFCVYEVVYPEEQSELPGVPQTMGLTQLPLTLHSFFGTFNEDFQGDENNFTSQTLSIQITCKQDLETDKMTEITAELPGGKKYSLRLEP